MKKCLLSLIVVLLLASAVLVAFEITPGLVSFNAGEISPMMDMRSDFGKYNNACRELENMLILSQGPIIRRPGTKYIATSPSAQSARLISFEYSKTDAYIILITDGRMDFFR